MPNAAVPRAARRERRLSFRATHEERRVIEQAGWLETFGDVTNFVMRASVDAARQVIERHEVSRVTDDIRRDFCDLLLNPTAGVGVAQAGRSSGA